ncbi:MAG: hypothetical protein JNM00_01430 [Flavobacteriales bacterium]|nr:hypothetical protein [Flavobacteriales bacterium]
MTPKLTAFLILFLTIYFQKANSQSPTFIAALETFQTEQTDREPPSDTLSRIIRPLFYKEGNQWNSLMDPTTNGHPYPKQMSWSIAYDGKLLGTTRSTIGSWDHPDCLWCFPRDAYHNPESTDLPIKTAEPARFMSWSKFENNYRPLILLSEPNYRDPQSWKRYTPTPSDLMKLLPSYVADNNLDALPEGVSITSSEAYRSADGALLICVKTISGDSKQYVDPFWYIDSIWYYCDTSGKALNLSKQINLRFTLDDFEDDDVAEITLVDAGDYDNDGISEWIFWTPRYNGDGYVLFYNKGQEMSEFVWSYH